ATAQCATSRAIHSTHCCAHRACSWLDLGVATVDKGRSDVVRSDVCRGRVGEQRIERRLLFRLGGVSYVLHCLLPVHTHLSSQAGDDLTYLAGLSVQLLGVPLIRLFGEAQCLLPACQTLLR